jgi:sucrose synthase
VSARFESVAALRAALRRALVKLEKLDEDAPYSAAAEPLSKLGFAAGWGDTAGRAAEMMSLLVDILEAPSPSSLEAFLARIPMISKILILSPHGYFGQDNVLGLPDTGGQVVYILDQVRALEGEMRDRLARQGVSVEPSIVIVSRLIPECGNTTCHERLEKVSGTAGARILRVPFLRPNGEIVPQWISRFAVWPYLPQFARDVEREALAELGGRPDLIIGNYSDGNLVASLLSQKLGVTQCNIAHALEINKYPLSTLRWKDYEETYHFSCQYTADLIAMNTADFIVTSTYQEIAGSDAGVGQYEAYADFTLPGLYRVLNGIDLFDPKFNVVSPGADPDVYFPYTEKERGLSALVPTIDAMVFGAEPLPYARGALEDRDKPIVFTMARLDRIKNLTGLVEWFALSDRLRKAANLLVIGGSVDPAQSSDHEEVEQIRLMHELMDHFSLDRQVRWIGKRLDRFLSGEVYRWVAGRRGVFVQPALFEGFGLTVIEAMASGLPTFATRYGGPAEIIENGRSGFHIDPHDGAGSADRIAEFLERCREEPREWERVSRAAVRRVEERYTWKSYAERIMTFARIYGFWKFVSNLEREETSRYLHMLYQLQLRPLAEACGKATGESGRGRESEATAGLGGQALDV